MKRHLFLLLSLSSVLWSITAEAGSMADYTNYPIHMVSTIKPNVVLLLDNSGSMKSVAYWDQNVPWQAKDMPMSDYSSSTSYYGYFDSTSRYSYYKTANDGYFYEDPSGEWDGSFLNWATMRRVDIARKVLVGGKIGWNERQGPGPYYLLGQNEPADTIFTKYIPANNVAPFQNGLLTAINGKAHVSRFSKDGELEVGRIKISTEWQYVSFSTTFNSIPVVVAKPTYHMCTASEVRIKDVSATGFRIKLEGFKEGGDCDIDTDYSIYPFSTVTFMAVTPGTHTFDNLKLQANKFWALNSNVYTITFPTPFTNTPIVLSSVCTSNDPDVVVTRNKNVTTSGFQVFMQEGEGKTDGHNWEKISWIAIEIPVVDGTGTVEGQNFQVGIKSGVTHGISTINVSCASCHQDFSPLLLADMQTCNDSDTANLGLVYPSKGDRNVKAEIRVIEEKTLDEETNHLGEDVGYIAFSVPSYNIKVRVDEDEPPTGVVQEIKDKVRLGLAVYNYDHTRTGDAIYNGNTANGGTLCPTWIWEEDGVMHETPTHVKAPTENIIRAIEEYPQVWGTTPTAETLYEIKNYFQQVPPYFPDHPGMTGADLRKIYEINDEWDPYYYDEFDDANKKPYCGKSFVIIISDGAPWLDFWINSWQPDSEIIDAVNRLGVPSDVSGNEVDYVDDVAWYVHTNDLRTPDNNDIEGEQTISVYTILAAFVGEYGASPWEERSMKDAAVNGGFEDEDEDNWPDPTHKDVKEQGNKVDWTDWNGTSDEWDKNDDKIPDNYFLAKDGAGLKENLLETFADIIRQTSSSTAASVMSTTGEAKGVVFQAYFKPFAEETEARWMGYMKGLWVDPWGNMREDSNSNQTLDLADDKIIQFVVDDDNEVQVFKYGDGTDGYGDPDGIRDTCPDPGCDPWMCGEDVCQADGGGGTMDDIIPIWEAGEELAETVTSDRNIKTWIDINNNGDVDSGEFIDFNTSNAPIMRPYLGVATDAEAEKIIRFIRGEDIDGYRERTVEVNGIDRVWKLGDIVNSSPTLVGRPLERMHEYYSDETYGNFFNDYKNRLINIYVGANDGMLHAFNGGRFIEDAFETESTGCAPAFGEGLGEERWAYIPYNLLPHLKWLADPDYTHVAYVDLKPRITDARIFNPDAVHPSGWGTILIGGMGFGGGEIELYDNFWNGGCETRPYRSAYFCLDITEPANPILLWERTHDKLGFTTSYPGIVRVEETEGFQDPEDDEWFAIFGSGPTDYDGTSDQKARFFVLNLYTGEIVNLEDPENPDTSDLLNEFISSKLNGFMASPVTVDYNLNYNDDLIYIGETYAATGGSAGKGRMQRISTRGGDFNIDSFTYFTDPSDWTMSTLTDGFWDTGAPLPPITTPAIASVDKEKNLWVYFGTGRYFNNEDKFDTSLQGFLGVIDDYWNYGEGDTKNGDGAKTNIDYNTGWSNASNWEVRTDGVLEADGGEYRFEEKIDYVKSLPKAWWIQLGFGNNPGERLLTRPSILGGTVFFTTFKPNTDVCACGGNSYLYALYYETGTAYKKSVIGKKDGKNLREIELGVGHAAGVGIHIGNTGKRRAGRTIIQQSSGAIDQINFNPALSIGSGICAWQQR